jgi:hypothetical protein
VGTGLALVVAALICAPPPEEVRAAQRAVFASEKYQKRIPGEAPPMPDPVFPPPRREEPPRPAPTVEEPPPPPPRTDTTPRRAPEPPPRESSSGEGPGKRILAALFWVLVGGLGVVVIAWGVKQVRRRPKDATVAVAAPAPPAPVAEVVEKPLSAAEVLAKKGLFAEAIHELLLMTIAALAAASRPPPSWTSREILASARMPEEARGELAALVAAAEASHFGGHRQTEPDWRACHAGFQRFAIAYAGSAA